MDNLEIAYNAEKSWTTAIVTSDERYGCCGSGNFIYLAYRELVRLEISLLEKIKKEFSAKEYYKHVKSVSLISPKQFFGIDRDSFGVELAKVTLMLAKKLALDEAYDVLERDQIELPLSQEEALPLDNLDDNLLCEDALFAEWPEVNSIIGNPPYQSKNKLQQELGRSYINQVRERYPDVDGRADYCVYWFRRAHDHLKEGQRAGLVGTNTIRQNYSRVEGLDYIVANGGTIVEAVSTMNWSGEAVVHVSIVNWMKGEEAGPKRLYIQEDDNDAAKGWRYKDFEKIGPSLSFDVDVTSAETIKVNALKGGCYQGQTHGHAGFLLNKKEAETLINKDPNNEEVLFPYLTANELIAEKDSLPKRYVIDFYPRDLLQAKNIKDLYLRVESAVLPTRQDAADKEEERNREALTNNPRAKVNHHHRNFLNKWWLLSYAREDMLNAINKLERYIVCGRVTKRPIFEFVSKSIHPNDALMVFPYQDDYSFGVLQSTFHWVWFINRCSTLKGDPRYTSNTVFDSFPWPQSPSETNVADIAAASQNYRKIRKELMNEHDLSLRDLYRSIELPGKHPLKDAQESLDNAVQKTYGLNNRGEILTFILELNEEVVAKENSMQPVLGPGLPIFIEDKEKYYSSDCLKL